MIYFSLSITEVDIKKSILERVPDAVQTSGKTYYMLYQLVISGCKSTKKMRAVYNHCERCLKVH